MDTADKLRNPHVLFREVQKMNQKFAWAVVLVPAAINWFGAYQQFILKKPFGSNPAPDGVMLVFLVVFGILFPLFFYSLKLITEVRDDGLYVRFYPFQLSFKKFPFESIRGFEVRTYSPIRDYGGWGIRCGPKGSAYNTSGNRGVIFWLDKEKKTQELLIGSQNPEKLAMAVRQGMELKSSA